MKNILLVFLTLLYVFGLLTNNSIEKDKSYSAYCGKFLSAKPVAKSAGPNQGDVLPDFKFLLEGEEPVLAKSLVDFQYHTFLNRFFAIKPKMNTTYFSFLNHIPDSLPSLTQFLPS